MATIQIVGRNSNLVALIDDEDLERIGKHKWHLNQGYAKTKLNAKTVSMHRMVLKAPPGDHKANQIDHINGNRLDNRKSNLRFASVSENQANRKLGSNNTSGYKGVDHSRGRWRALIKINGKKKYIGSFDTPEQAAKAYDKKAIEFFGVFALTNFQ